MADLEVVQSVMRTFPCVHCRELKDPRIKQKIQKLQLPYQPQLLLWAQAFSSLTHELLPAPHPPEEALIKRFLGRIAE